MVVVCTSYVGAQPKGPLHIISLNNETLTFVSVVFGTEKIRMRLLACEPLEDIVAGLKSFQHTKSSFSIANLQKVVWNDFSSDIRFDFFVEGKIKSIKTYIVSYDDRDRMLKAIADSSPDQTHCYDEFASVWAVASTRIIGALIALVGTFFFTAMWDPARLNRIKNGTLALLLGRNGCAVLGFGIFIACCISTWIAIRKQSRFYTCEFRPGQAGSHKR